MSDAPREEEIYQALAPGGSYKTGLVSPVAAQSDQLVSTPMRFKGAMGGQAVGNDDYPDHEPRASVPYQRYKDLEDTDPKLHEAVTHVADDLKIPRTDLASLVYANSDNNPNASNGARTGYMGLTPDDARNLDPEGHLNINDPIDNLYLGAMKYKRMANRFGMGSPNAFAAYHGGGDTVNNLLARNPDEHARSAPDGMFSFLNKVLGRGEGSGSSSSPSTVDDAAGSDQPGGDVAAMAAAAQAEQQPQRYAPARGAVAPMVPNQPRGDRDLEPSVGAALAQSRLPGPAAPPATVWQPPPPAQPAPEQLEFRAPESERPTPEGDQVPLPDVAGALQRHFSRGNIAPRQPNYDTPYQPPPGTPIPPGQGAPGAEQMADRADYPPAPPTTPPAGVPGAEQLDPRADYPPAPPVLSGRTGVLAPAPGERQEYQPPFTPGPPRTSGGYAVGGAIPGAVQGAGLPPGQPPAVPGQAAQAQAPTGSGAPPAAPRQQAIGTDQMAPQLNQQELARVQGGRPDVLPTGPTQAPAPASTAAADAARDARAPTTPESVERMRARAEQDPEYARELGAQVTANTESSNPALVAARASAARAPTEPGAYTAIGDSLAAHMIRKGGARGQEDPNKIGSYREGDTAVSGWGTQKVLELIDKIPLGQIQGQNVVLSTGASNSPADLAAVPKQIARLKELGAKSVSVVGVGTRDDFAGVNDKLAGFVAGAKDPSVVFAGPLPNVGADKVHSTDPTSVLHSAQQALAKAGGGDPVPTATTGSGAGPTPTTTPGAGGGGTGAAAGMPAANLPAGAPRALAPPGSAPTATSAPPIDRLKGSPTAMTAAGVVRAAASGGPDGVLTYMTRNAPRGMSVGEGWDHTRDLMAQSLMLQGKFSELHHVDEYIFRMQHKGAMDNVMQAIGNMDDPNTAAQYLAKAHAFVTDGTQVGFQVLDGKIFGQRYDEQTHNKIGGPFQVTEQGLRRQALANYDPAHFSTNLNAERQTNETGRHNLQTEDHANRQLTQQDEASRRSLEEKKLEFDVTENRRRDLADQAERTRRDLADQTNQTRLEAAQARAHERQLAQDQARAARQESDAQRAAGEAASHAKDVTAEVADYYGSGTQPATATDVNNQPFKGPALAQARQLHAAIRHNDKGVTDPESALDIVRGVMAGNYEVREDDKGYAAVREKTGEKRVLATFPRTAYRAYLPAQLKRPEGAPPVAIPRGP